MYIILIISEVVIITLSIWLARIYCSIYPTCVEATVCNSHSIRDAFELPSNLVAFIQVAWKLILYVCMYLN